MSRELRAAESRIGIVRIVAVLAMTASFGCGADPEPSQEPAKQPGPSAAVCASGSTLTYDNFASAFFASHCTRCHSSTLAGADRNGAPSTFNYDTLEGVRAVSAAKIDAMAAAGPAQLNTFMPPSDPRPSAEDRERLGDWLACGSP